MTDDRAQSIAHEAICGCPNPNAKGHAFTIDLAARIREYGNQRHTEGMLLEWERSDEGKRQQAKIDQLRAALDNTRGVLAEARDHLPVAHYDCEDSWYSCATICCNDARRSEKCDCGATDGIELVAKIDRLLLGEGE